MADPVPTAVLFGSAVVIAFYLGYVYRIWQTQEPPAGPVEELLTERRETLRNRYASGEISRSQFGAEIEIVEDPSTERIMHLARDVDGVGPEIAYKIARNFDGIAELANASHEELEAINRVGENRANAVLQRAQQELEE